jgi:hypothetical protein
VYSDDAMAGRYRLNEGTGTPPPGYVTRGGTLVVNGVRVPIPPTLRQQMAQHSLAATIERGHAENEPERERLRELRRARGPARELSWPEASAIAEDAEATAAAPAAPRPARADDRRPARTDGAPAAP